MSRIEELKAECARLLKERDAQVSRLTSVKESLEPLLKERAALQAKLRPLRKQKIAITQSPEFKDAFNAYADACNELSAAQKRAKRAAERDQAKRIRAAERAQRRG